jgi:hypothetical protein
LKKVHKDAILKKAVTSDIFFKLFKSAIDRKTVRDNGINPKSSRGSTVFEISSKELSIRFFDLAGREENKYEYLPLVQENKQILEE